MDDIGLPSGRPVSLRETVPLLVPRWIAAWLDPRPPPLRYCALASMLATGRRSCRSGHTAHGSAASYSAWHTPIACVGVLVLYLPGFWPFPACPRTYLRTSPIKAGSLPSSAFCCTPSSVLRTPRTPSRLRPLSAVRLYTRGLCPTWLPGRVSPVPLSFSRNVPSPIPRRGPAAAPVSPAVCCLRRDMIGSALPNTFRLIICRGCSVHGALRPASLLPSLSKALDAPLWPVGSLLSAGACYRALWRLPGRDSHPLEERVFQDAP